MKQRLFLIFMPLLILTLNSNLVLGEEFIFIPHYKFEIIENGKPSGVKGIGEITIRELRGKFHAKMKDVLITPFESSQKIWLTSYIYTTEDSYISNDSLISNVEVDRYHFSFTVGNRFNIVGKIKNDGKGYDISGSGLRWDYILKDTIKVEMRTIDKIILPYNEVYP